MKKDKHLEANKNEEVEIKLFKPFEEKKQYKGILKDFDKEIITITIESKDISLDRKNIAQIKTVYNW